MTGATDSDVSARPACRLQAWREFLHPNGETITHQRFTDWIAAPAPRGLGTTVQRVRDVVTHDKEALDLLDRALQQPHGGNRRSADIKNNNVKLDQKPPTGNSESAALRRLRKDRPDLHAEVLSGTLKAHSAMVQAGFRPKTFTVRADRPEAIAAVLRKQLDAEVLGRVLALLSGPS